MTAFYAGDAEAVGELFARYRGRLIGYFAKQGLRPDLAEDRSQEVLLRVMATRTAGPERRYDPGRSFPTWLFTLAYYEFLHALDEREGDVRRLGSGEEELDPPASGPRPEDAFWQGVARSTVRQCACRLPDDRLRQVIEGWLSTEGAQKLRELGETMGVSIGGAFNLRARAFEAMRACLEAEGV